MSEGIIAYKLLKNLPALPQGALFEEDLNNKGEWICYKESIIKPIRYRFIEKDLRCNENWFKPIFNSSIENEQCPVCGFYCTGRGGFGCIDKQGFMTTSEGKKYKCGINSDTEI